MSPRGQLTVNPRPDRPGLAGPRRPAQGKAPPTICPSPPRSSPWAASCRPTWTRSAPWSASCRWTARSATSTASCRWPTRRRRWATSCSLVPVVDAPDPDPEHRRLPCGDAGPPRHALPRLPSHRALPRHPGPRRRPAGLHRRRSGHKRGRSIHTNTTWGFIVTRSWGRGQGPE